MFPATQQTRYSRRRPRDEDEDEVAATQPAVRSRRSTQPLSQSSQSNNQSQSAEGEAEVVDEVPQPWTPYVVPYIVLTDASDSNAQFPGPLKTKTQAEIDTLVGDLLNFVLAKGGSTSRARNDLIKLDDINSVVLANGRARGSARYLLRDAARRLDMMTGLKLIELPPKISENAVSAHPSSAAKKKKAASDKAAAVDKAVTTDNFVIINPHAEQDQVEDIGQLTNVGRRLNAERGLLLFVLDLVTWAFEGSILNEVFLFTTLAEQCFGQSFANFTDMKNHPLFGDVTSLIQHRFVSQQYLERFLLQDASQASEYGGDGDNTQYHYRLGPRAYVEYDLEGRFKHAQEVILQQVVRPDALKEVQRKEKTRKLQQGLNVVTDPSHQPAPRQPLARIPASQQTLDLPEAYKTVLRHLLMTGAMTEEQCKNLINQYSSSEDHSLAAMIIAFNDALQFAQFSVKQAVYDVTGDSYLTLENNNQSLGQAIPSMVTSAFTDSEILAIKVIMKYLAQLEEERGLAYITRLDTIQRIRAEHASTSKATAVTIEQNIVSLIELGWLFEQPDSFHLSIGVRAQTNHSINQFMQEAYSRHEALTCHTCKAPAYYAQRCCHVVRGDNDEIVRRCNFRFHLHCMKRLVSRTKNGIVKCPGGHNYEPKPPKKSPTSSARSSQSQSQDD